MSRIIFTCALLFISLIGYSYDLAIVAKFKNESAYLKEWIEYHLMVGVEHFWLYNDLSDDEYEEILEPYIQKGIVELFDWPTPLNKRHVPYQVKAMKDGLSRAINVSKWVALIDLDEYLLPMKDKTIVACLENHFSHASAVYVNWLNFGTSGITIPRGDPILFLLQKCALPTHPHNAVGKSIVRPEHVDIDKIWYPHHCPLKPRYKCVNGEGDRMTYRGVDLPTDGKHHAKFIRINHYIFRDEPFFHNRRIVEDRYKNKGHMMELYHSFSLSNDDKIIQFIKQFHPKKYLEIWANTSFAN